MDAKSLQAFDAGTAFYFGLKYGKKNIVAVRKIAQDAEQWITVHPNGAEHTGQPALIDGETGNVLGGFGGKFTGQHISQVKGAKRLKQERQSAREQRMATRNKLPEKLDLKNPDKIPQEHILQNRDRSSTASVMQMKSIAQNPDYDRLSGSKDFGSGAPVVAYGSIPENQLGTTTWAVMPDGTKYPVQYAVVEADSVLTSNNINGATNNEYFSDDASKTRAIAGNGRITGLAEAYNKGTAQEYNDSLYSDRTHGVSQDVIDGMKNPVLVRVMQPKDVSADIGDKSNVQAGMSLSAIERANNDAKRVNFNEIQTYSDGRPTNETLREFIRKMPPSEQSGLISSRGEPTKLAEERFRSAVFASAYQNDKLTQLHSEALEPESKNIINALEKSAPAMQRLNGLGNGYDVRDIVATSAERAISARANGKNLYDVATERDMFKNDNVNSAENRIIKLFADNPRSSAKISEKLTKMAERLEQEGHGANMFGEQISPDEIIKRSLSEDSELPARPKMTKLAMDYWSKYGGEFLEAIFTDKPIPSDFLSGLKQVSIGA